MSDALDEIPVWVGRSLKWVTGLTKRTTFDDVIYALLYQEGKSFAEVQTNVIMEQWQGVRRPLNGRTKVIKVLKAWGDHRRDQVTFSLHRRERDSSPEVQVKRAHRKRKERASAASSHAQVSTRGNPSSSHHIASDQKYEATCNVYDNQTYRTLAPQAANNANVAGAARAGQEDDDTARTATLKRSVRVNLARLGGASMAAEEVGKKKRDHQRHGAAAVATAALKSSSSDESVLLNSMQFEDMQKYVRLVLEQDRQLRELIGRVDMMDVEIEQRETQTHLDRIRQNGRNYVIDSYLEQQTSSGDMSPVQPGLPPGSHDDSIVNEDDIAFAFPDINHEEMDRYLNVCQNVLTLQERITAEEEKMHRLVQEVEGERRRLAGCPSTASAAAAAAIDSCAPMLQETGRELFCKELTRLDVEINRSDTAIDEKLRLLMDLELQLHDADVEDDGEDDAEDEPVHRDEEADHCVPAIYENQVVIADLGLTVSDDGSHSELTQSDPASSSSITEFYVTKFNTESVRKDALYDNDSDTGLSSMHSDEGVPVLETLV